MDASSAQDIVCRYFPKPGPRNTKAVLDAVANHISQNPVGSLLVASCTGKSAFKAVDTLAGRINIVAVTHVTGFAKPNHQEMQESSRRELERRGVRVLTAQHAFGGIGRAVRKKLDTYQIDEIMAYTLRTFGQGTKVAIEIALMAADAGFIRTDQDIVSIGGTGSGLDTALVIKPANSADFFDLKVRAIICKPAIF